MYDIMKKFLIMMLYLCLSSCGDVGKLMPSLGYEKDNQSTSSADTLSQSIGYASVSMTAGKNKSRSYNKSNIKSSDLNTESELNQSTSATNYGGTHTDNSYKSLLSTTNKDNKKTSYNSSANQVIYNRMTILELLSILLFISIITAFIVYISYHVGVKIGRLKTKVNDMKIRYNNYRGNKRLNIK